MPFCSANGIPHVDVRQKNMKYISPIAIAAFLAFTGCVKKEEFKAHQADVDERLEALERFSSYYTNPLTFEIHDMKVDGEDVSAVIRALDGRIKGRTVYLDAVMDVYSGETKVTENSEFLRVTDGIGKIDTSLWLSSEAERKVDPSKGISIKIRLLGWFEMFPGVIQQK